MATYLLHNNRFYCGNDVHHVGHSVSRAEFAAGKNPVPPRRGVECFETPDTLTQVVAMQRARQGLAPAEEPTPTLRTAQVQAAPRRYREESKNALACRHCGYIGCRCGVQPLGDTLHKIVTEQARHGQR